MTKGFVLKYSFLSKLFHWSIALLVIAMLTVGFFLDDFPDSLKGTAYMLHKSTGITLLFLMIIRFFWIQFKGRPVLPNSMKSWEKGLSHFVQYGFYLLLIIMPFSGWIMSVAADKVPVYFGLFRASLPIGPNQELAQFMSNVHAIIAWVLISFIVLHLMGALKHHFINKDDVLRRMLP